MKNIVRALKTVNYRLWLAILLMMLLPTVYLTVRIYFIGDMPGDWGYNIASQLAWVNLFYEVIQEALILPIFFLLGKSLFDRKELENKVNTGLLVTGSIYFFVSLIIVIFARQLVVFMVQNAELVDQTVDYIRLETFAALFSTLTRFIMLVLITLKKDKYMYITLGVQMVLSIIIDTFLISSMSFSLNMGVNGIAVSNIIVNIFILLIAFALLKRENINIFTKEKLSFAWIREWFYVGKFSGLESFLRNFAFMIMIIRMVNVVSEQGNYWITNNFIWHWLLLPALALADLVKKEIGEDQDNIRSKTFGYLMFASIFAIIWLLSIPLWKPFLQYVMNVQDYNTVFNIVLIQTVFYLTFIFNSCIFDSTFYGLGKTKYMLIQSICIDVFYYGIAFILYITGVFVPTLIGISLLFGIGMVMDLIPTMILYVRLLKKKEIKIDFILA
ncbi:MAG: multidrug transporter [Tenericutes bacterium HGW-Tenericutes-2]|jgi:Na+-driven multidrug efflux pump|nr:MAG: multidrug transporter [Tenericutes bacterium HGW-Tenericutes-2]